MTDIQKRLEEIERSQLVIGLRARELGHSCSALQTQGAMDRDRLQAALTSELALEGGGQEQS